MAATFDNLEDVVGKFSGTIVLYNKKAALVKASEQSMNKEDDFILRLAFPQAKQLKAVSLADPLLDYKNYVLGYVNGGKYCSWWFRKPYRQYAQGLKSNQMGCRLSFPGVAAHDQFSFTKPFISMIEGEYPHLEQCKKLVIDKVVVACAFHQDFALSFDEVHDDFVIEYRGRKIGAAIDKNLEKFKIMSDYRHLIEPLQEARRVHA